MRSIIFTLCIGYLLVLFTVPVDASEMKMDEHSSLTKVSHKFADAHEEKRSSSPSSKHQSAHTDGHPSHSGKSGCCNDGCMCIATNCYHFTSLFYVPIRQFETTFAEQYDIIALAVPFKIFTPPFRPPIA